MPCSQCGKTGHNRKTCSELSYTLSTNLSCPGCECDFIETAFSILNCGHAMCLTCTINMGSSSNNFCVDCAKDNDKIAEVSVMSELYNASPPPSPSKNNDLIEVSQHGVLYCKRTNTYMYNRVRFNTLRAAINCRKAHIMLGYETRSMGKGIYIYNENSYNSLEPLRRAQTADIFNHVSNNKLDLAISTAI